MHEPIPNLEIINPTAEPILLPDQISSAQGKTEAIKSLRYPKLQINPALENSSELLQHPPLTTGGLLDLVDAEVEWLRGEGFSVPEYEWVYYPESGLESNEELKSEVLLRAGHNLTEAPPNSVIDFELPDGLLLAQRTEVITPIRVLDMDAHKELQHLRDFMNAYYGDERMIEKFKQQPMNGDGKYMFGDGISAYQDVIYGHGRASGTTGPWWVDVDPIIRRAR